VPDAAAVPGRPRPSSATARRLASQVGAGRARSSSGAGRSSSPARGRAAPRLLHVRLGSTSTRPARGRRARRADGAVELVPADPPSPERAYALGSLAGGLDAGRRYGESLALAEQALALAAPSAPARRRCGRSPWSAWTSPTSAAARRASPDARGAAAGRGDRRPLGPRPRLREPHRRAHDARPPRESAQVGQEALEAMRRYGIHST
jgi:hypothetical protein